jgi:hypothetical protein
LTRAASRDAVFHPEFREDLRYWVKSERNTALRVLDLVEATLRDPISSLSLGGLPPRRRMILSKALKSARARRSAKYVAV